MPSSDIRQVTWYCGSIMIPCTSLSAAPVANPVENNIWATIQTTKQKMEPSTTFARSWGISWDQRLSSKQVTYISMPNMVSLWKMPHQYGAPTTHHQYPNLQQHRGSLIQRHPKEKKSKSIDMRFYKPQDKKNSGPVQYLLATRIRQPWRLTNQAPLPVPPLHNAVQISSHKTVNQKYPTVLCKCTIIHKTRPQKTQPSP